ncbi:hypothetical protein [Nitrincola alkalilacustris]|uniref:hypothetical protein n=1 Tax=Nitrincola alkalilacustris TaxID=1571224 RepID=UPI00124D9494|nr:hypothetical protein [Nitrincola alkalilacustris]
MAVLVEVTSVIIRASAIDELIEGGWESFRTRLPTDRVCSDGELISVILINPPDVTAFADQLIAMGLNFRWGQDSPDVVFADQKRGLISACDWAEFSHVNIGIGGTGPSVAICRLAGSQLNELRLPPDWQYRGSLTETFGADAVPY